MSDFVRLVLFPLIIISLLVFAMMEDHKEGQEELRSYCEQVAKDIIPDYKGWVEKGYCNGE